ncbi:hypothetical protein NKJ71_25655 [Mesorhizobium sp. M0050]|uniref:hypothetical protein n=1 Tax=Mesorhizobium sp. M0050 TaxID=2956861 RepID=UPI003338FF4D
MSESITFRQLRVCLMVATEGINGADTGSTLSERIGELCNQYDAQRSPEMEDLVGQLTTFVRQTR